MKIRTLTPISDDPPPSVANSRRATRRRPFTERVTFVRGPQKVLGWALNISQGGLRAILDEPVDLGHCYEITLGDLGKRTGRVVWIHEEPDGAIVGVAFVELRIEASLDEARQS